MWCSSGPSPVAMLDAATGVTDGKLDTQSRTYVPRCISAASAGARPWSIARSSISGLRASMTARKSFLGFVLNAGGSVRPRMGGRTGSPENAEALVLLARLCAPARNQQQERHERKVARYVHGDRQRGEA